MGRPRSSTSFQLEPRIFRRKQFVLWNPGLTSRVLPARLESTCQAGNKLYPRSWTSLPLRQVEISPKRDFFARVFVSGRRDGGERHVETKLSSIATISAASTNLL